MSAANLSMMLRRVDAGVDFHAGKAASAADTAALTSDSPARGTRSETRVFVVGLETLRVVGFWGLVYSLLMKSWVGRLSREKGKEDMMACGYPVESGCVCGVEGCE
jgi:hypothetical protein